MSKYTKACCDRVIELGRLGYHHEEMASDLGVTRKTLHNWRNKHEAFDEAMEIANTHSIAYWASMPRRQIAGEIESLNPTTWIFTMKNKAGWVDRTETTVDNHTTVELDAEELVKQLADFGVDVSTL